MPQRGRKGAAELVHDLPGRGSPTAGQGTSSNLAPRMKCCSSARLAWSRIPHRRSRNWNSRPRPRAYLRGHTQGQVGKVGKMWQGCLSRCGQGWRDWYQAWALGGGDQPHHTGDAPPLRLPHRRKPGGEGGCWASEAATHSRMLGTTFLRRESRSDLVSLNVDETKTRTVRFVSSQTLRTLHARGVRLRAVPGGPGAARQVRQAGGAQTPPWRLGQGAGARTHGKLQVRMAHSPPTAGRQLLCAGLRRGAEREENVCVCVCVVVVVGGGGWPHCT